MTLDGVDRNLPTDALMICDGKGPVAVGGIMGGLDSEIEETPMEEAGSEETRLSVETMQQDEYK